MNFGVGLFLVIIGFAALVCSAGRYFSRQKLLHGRQPQALAEIVSDLPETIRRDDASEVLQMIGKSFGVRPEVLRLHVPMSALTAMDSWTLGHGQGELERWLRAKGVSSLHRKPATIGELIMSALPLDARRQGITG